MINLDSLTKAELKQLQKEIKIKLDERCQKGYHVSFNIVFDTQYIDTIYARHLVDDNLVKLFHKFNTDFKVEVIKNFEVSILNEKQLRTLYNTPFMRNLIENVPKLTP